MRTITVLSLLVLGCGVIPLLAGTICPAVTPNPGITDPSGCNVIITITDHGMTATPVDLHTYNGLDDQLVGIVNNGPTDIESLPLTGPGIFAFDGNGMCSDSFIDANFCTIFPDPMGYGGDNVTFTITNSDTGVVHFNFAPAIVIGSTYFFSLEGVPRVGGITPGPVPEPGTLAIMGFGLFGIRFGARKHSSSTKL